MEPRWRHIVASTVRIPGNHDPALKPRDLDGGRAAPGGPGARRRLVAALSIDAAGSTEQAGRLGDDHWLDLLVAYHAMAHRQIGLHGGSVVNVVGDGVWAVFTLPGEAIRCAMITLERVYDLGIELRAGLHAGECEQVGGSIEGIAMHICARVTAKARPGEILVTGTVKDLVTGTPLVFQERDTHQLRGVQGRWPLYAVSGYRPSAPLW